MCKIIYFIIKLLYNIYGDIMKKILLTVLLLVFYTPIDAEEIKVEFSKCVDGDTAKFIYNDEEITTRFLAIDTPETVHPTKEVEQYGKEASDYTCKRIKEAHNIILEFDENSDRKDKYGRYLVWVFLDDSLLQKELVSNGLANVAYLYDDYKYTDKLENAEQLAEENKLGIWNINSNEDNTVDNEILEEKTDKENKENKEEQDFFEKYKEYIILVGALIIVSIFNLKAKKKIKRKLKNTIKNDIKKRLK